MREKLLEVLNIVRAGDEPEIFCSRCGLPFTILVISETGLKLVCRCPE